MIIDHTFRRSGKTTRAVNWVRAKDTRILVVINETMRDIMRAEYSDIATRIVTIDEAKTLKDVDIAIDNADCLLNEMLGGNVKVMTVSTEDSESANYVFQ